MTAALCSLFVTIFRFTVLPKVHLFFYKYYSRPNLYYYYPKGNMEGEPKKKRENMEGSNFPEELWEII